MRYRERAQRASQLCRAQRHTTWHHVTPTAVAPGVNGQSPKAARARSPQQNCLPRKYRRATPPSQLKTSRNSSSSSSSNSDGLSNSLNNDSDDCHCQVNYPSIRRFVDSTDNSHSFPLLSVQLLETDIALLLAMAMTMAITTELFINSTDFS